MNRKDWMLALVEAGAWYGLAYTVLFSIKHDVNLALSSLIILALLYVGGMSCPFIRHTQAWKDLWKN